MPQIFLLEDDSSFGKSLKFYLEQNEYQVHWATDIKTGLIALAKASPDLFILDWNLPDGTGLDFMERAKLSAHATPIFFLTARSEEETAVSALTRGATDYLRKPLGNSELLVKIKKSLGEAKSASKVLRFNDLIVNLDARSASYKDKEIQLRPREMDILIAILKRSDQVISREHLLEQIDEDCSMSDRAIDGHISRLRKAVSEASNDKLTIKAIYGSGYKLSKTGQGE